MYAPRVTTGRFVIVVTVNVGPLAVPSGFVTDTVPLVAPVGTTNVILVKLLMLNVTLLPFNLTEFTLEKFVPFIVTVVPITPDVGEMEVIVGGAGGNVTVNIGPLAVPSGFVTATIPLVAPVGTIKINSVELFTLKETFNPFNVTLVTVVKLVPLTVTIVPTNPDVGLIDVIVGGVGGNVTVKTGPLALPSGFVTDTIPEVAPTGTIKVIDVLFTILNVSDVPFKLTEVTVFKLVPVIVTVVPTKPEVGLIEVMVGGNMGIVTT